MTNVSVDKIKTPKMAYFDTETHFDNDLCQHFVMFISFEYQVRQILLYYLEKKDSFLFVHFRPPQEALTEYASGRNDVIDCVSVFQMRFSCI